MPGDIAKEIDALQPMTTSELAERYQLSHCQPGCTRRRTESGSSHDRGVRVKGRPGVIKCLGGACALWCRLDTDPTVV